MKRDAETICFEDFMEWAGGEKPEEKPEVFTDPFGNTSCHHLEASIPPQNYAESTPYGKYHTYTHLERSFKRTT